ncbi:SDR family NAD(P)-dependent oxidoreductase [Seleniivibrio woodruffii]|uniref:SDR family NAD(P)-dependent oxidoreductase n=1 Tax=Seleniivibrio woodruffii TaxID=1078050 RepID=UPI0039E55BDB
MKILITGSSGGIGFAAAEELVRLGHSVLLTGRKQETLSASAGRLNSLAFCGDLSKTESVNRLYEFCNEQDFIPEAVVHTVGGTVNNDRHPLNTGTLEESMRLNLYSAAELNNLLIPLMQQNSGGRIIHISSQAAKDGNASPAYAMAKGALNIYIRNSARFYAQDNIMICGIMPGILDHEGSAWHQKSTENPKKYEERKSRQPLGRFLKPQDISGLIGFLATDRSMAYTGTIFDINGGE